MCKILRHFFSYYIFIISRHFFSYYSIILNSSLGVIIYYLILSSIDTFHESNMSNNKRTMLTNKIIIMIVKKAV